ncbi:MAG: hypothetical protein IJ748_02375 [Bacteroidales bacterium]|nr:hypothetical protein [Bacteroidales bacterium]
MLLKLIATNEKRLSEFMPFSVYGQTDGTKQCYALYMLMAVTDTDSLTTTPTEHISGLYWFTTITIYQKL